MPATADPIRSANPSVPVELCHNLEPDAFGLSCAGSTVIDKKLLVGRSSAASGTSGGVGGMAGLTKKT